MPNKWLWMIYKIQITFKQIDYGRRTVCNL